MNRVEFTNSKNLKLVGNLYPSVGDSIIIMCHGFLSNKYSRGRFDRLIKVLNKSGFSALAFDFRGCGESDDDSITVDKEVDDLKSAIAFVKSKGYKRIALYGHIKNITCPVLIIHGNNDDEEKLLCERSKKAVSLLSNGSKLKVIDGADHSFLKHYDILANLANHWFIKHML